MLYIHVGMHTCPHIYLYHKQFHPNLDEEVIFTIIVIIIILLLF